MKSVLSLSRLFRITGGLAVCLMAHAAVGSVVVEYPTAVNDGSPTIGVPGTYAPGFGNSSWQANGVSYSKLLLSPTTLFGHDVTIGDLKSISYWTNKNAPGSSVDWFLQIYTVKETGDPGSWYGYRINSEPYFSANLNAPANTWNKWVTDATNNQLRLYDSTSGYFGSYTDGFLSDLQTTLGSKHILSIGIATATGWANGFTGLVDGLTIELMNDQVAQVNLEAVPEPASLLVWTIGGLGLALASRRRKAAA